MLKRLLRRPLPRGALFALVSLAAVLVAGRINLFAIALENLEFMTYDWRLRHFSPAYQVTNAAHRGRIVTLAIDSASFAALKESRDMRWPWNRRLYAEALDRMTEAGAERVAFDIFFAEPSRHTADPGQDAALAEAVARSGRAVLACSAEDPLIPELAATTAETAFIEHVRDGDALSRRSRLLPGRPVGAPYSLALTTLLSLRGQTAGDIQPVGEPPYALRLPRVLESRGGKIEMRHPPLEIPLLDGHDMLVNFFTVDYFAPDIPFYEVLIGHDLERLRGKTVLIGATARNLHDHFPTPVSVTMPGGTMPGVHIHTNALATMLEGRFLTRPPGWFTPLFTLLLLLPLSAALARMRPRQAFALTLAALAFVFLFAIALFQMRVVTQIVAPCAAIALLFVALTAYNYLVEESEKRLIKHLFKQYVTEDVVEEILADPENPLVSAGTRRDVTILFADIRNFTGLAETLPPEEVVELLNRFFDRMTGLVFEHGGTLDKYLGDGLLALFGAPVARPTARIDAVRCALRMRDEAAKLIDERLAERKRPFDGIGVGLHAGEAVVGSIGSEKHREYTAIGSVVNLSSRIVSIAPAGTVYVSEALAASTAEAFSFGPEVRAAFKGVRGESAIFAVLGEKRVADA